MSRPAWKLRGLDPGIRQAVWALRREGIETNESCEGGPGHAYPVPTVAFSGSRGQGFRALEIVLRPSVQADIGQLHALRRVWSIVDGEPEGPFWELTWWPETGTCHKVSSDPPSRQSGSQAVCPAPQDRCAWCDTSDEVLARQCGTPAPSPWPEARQIVADTAQGQPSSLPSLPSSDPSVGDA